MIALAYPVARILVPGETSNSTFVFTWFAVFCLSTFALIITGFTRRLDWGALRFWSKNQLDEDVCFLSAVFFFQFLLRMCYQALSPHVTTGGDWLEHFERSKYFLYRSQEFVAPFLPWSIGDRTPLYNLTGAFFLGLIGDQYWVLQVFNCLSSGILLFPTYLISEELFDRRAARLTSLFVSINSYLMENSLYTWPKSMAAYFVLLFIYFLIVGRNFWWGCSAGLGYLTHGYSLLYLPIALLFLSKRSLKKWLFSITIVFGAVVLWSFFSYWNTGSPGRMIYYPLCVHGAEMVLKNTSTGILNVFLKTPILTIAFIRLRNLYRTCIPWPFFFFLIEDPIIREMFWFEYWNPRIAFHNVVWLYYSNTLMGALGVILYGATIHSILRRKKATSRFVLLPFFTSLVFVGWVTDGLARQTFQPLIPIMIAIAIEDILSTLHAKLLLVLSFFLTLVNHVVFISWWHVVHLTAQVAHHYPSILLYVSTAWETFVNPFNRLILVFGVIISTLAISKMFWNEFSVLHSSE